MTRCAEWTGADWSCWSDDDVLGWVVGLHFVGLGRERNGEITVKGDGTTFEARGNGDATMPGARDGNGRFVNGCAAGPGRAVGVPNKAAVVRDAILESWDAVDGPAILVRLARDDPRGYLRLVTSVLPREETVRAGVGETVRDTFCEDMATPEGQAWLARLREANPC